MAEKTQRRIELCLFDFDAHPEPQPTFPPEVRVDKRIKGEPDRSGLKPWRHNSVDFEYVGELPDSYDERVRLLIDALGGVAGIDQIKRKHNARESWVRMWMPAISSPDNQEGTLSALSLELLVNLKLDLEFWYT